MARRNKLFIWTGVLIDWSDGLIVALAPDVETAIAKVIEQRGADDIVADEMRHYTPEVHEVTAGNVVVEYTFGGG